MQKLNYIHNNPCVAGLCTIAKEYKHSSAMFYIAGEQGIYIVTSFMELRDIDLTSSVKSCFNILLNFRS